jgi:hypothetical protein
METGNDFSHPNTTSPELVGVPALVHQDVTCLENARQGFTVRKPHARDVGKIQMTILNVGYSQVRILDQVGGSVILTERKPTSHLGNKLQSSSPPMRRDLAKPGDAGVAERGVSVDSPGNGAGDERSVFLRQQPEYPLLRRHQRIQPCRLPIEVVDDGALLLNRRSRVSHNS